LVKPVHSLVPAKPGAQIAPSKQFVSVDAYRKMNKFVSLIIIYGGLLCFVKPKKIYYHFPTYECFSRDRASIRTVKSSWSS
jgi:hypothetical protein